MTANSRSDLRQKASMKETIGRKRKREAGVDRISKLPDDLIKGILSSLHTKEAARTALLSKRWGGLWKSLPSLDLDEVKFMARDFYYDLDPFIRDMKNILASHDMSYIRRLRIHSRSYHNDEAYSLFHNFITMSMKTRVQILDLNFSQPLNHIHHSCQQCYVLPTEIFSSGTELVYLNLESCQFGSYPVMKFWSLKTLSLKSTHMSEQILFQMTSASPSLETLILEDCCGLTALRVRHTSLRCLIVNLSLDLKAFEIDVPNLQSFRCTLDKYLFTAPCILEFNKTIVNSFPNLTHLYLSCLEMKEEVFQSLLSRCSNLKTFFIQKCRLRGRLRVVCKKLKIFEVDGCPIEGLMEVDSSCLESVVLRCKGNIRVNFFDGTGFSSLKNITLCGLDDLTDDLLHELLCQSPIVHVLVVDCCLNLTKVDISSQTLKELVLKQCCQLNKGAITAPKLAYFKYMGGAIEFSHIITSPHLDAEINLRCYACVMGEEYCTVSHPTIVRNILLKLGQARSVTLVGITPEHIIIPKEVCLLPPFFYLRHLKVVTSLGRMSYTRLLLGVLHTSMCRETLSIDVVRSELELKFKEVICEGSRHDCIREHLVEARIELFRGERQEMEIVEYLLGKATLLKTLVISLSPNATNLLEIGVKIRNFRKVSPFCTVQYM